MRGKVVWVTVLVVLLVGWMLGGMLLGGRILLDEHQAAQAHLAAITFKAACHAGHLDACDQELQAQFNSGQLTYQADLYQFAFTLWAGGTALAGALAAGVFLRARWQGQQPPWSWSRR